MTPDRVVPWLQSVYDLMCAEVETDPATAELVDAWTRRTGLVLPAAVREFYVTTVRIPLADASGEPVASGGSWRLSLPDLWREFSGDCHLSSLVEVLAAVEATHAGRDPSVGLWADTPMGSGRRPDASLLVHFEHDVHATLHDFFESGRGDDPAVFVHSRDRHNPGWSKDRETFSDWMFDWFASFYGDDSMPRSFFGPDADWNAAEEASPARPYRNGLWARATDTAIAAASLADLVDAFGWPYARLLAGGARSFHWSPPTGEIRVTTDAVNDGDGVSVWWVHSGTVDGLRDLLRRVSRPPARVFHTSPWNTSADAHRTIDEVAAGRVVPRS